MRRPDWNESAGTLARSKPWPSDAARAEMRETDRSAKEMAATDAAQVMQALMRAIRRTGELDVRLGVTLFAGAVNVGQFRHVIGSC